MILENKKRLSERDICTKFITTAIKQAGWDVLSQIREEVSFTRGGIIVRGLRAPRPRWPEGLFDDQADPLRAPEVLH